MCKIILKKLAKISNLPLYIKDDINEFVEKLVLIINKSIESSILL